MEHIFNIKKRNFNSFMEEVPILKKTKQSICSANQWTGFSMIGASIRKEAI